MLIEKAECGKYKMMMKYSNESLPAISSWVGQCQADLNQCFLSRPHIMSELKSSLRILERDSSSFLLFTL